MPLDETRQWYRFHSLFQDFLQRRLNRDYSEEVINQLHYKAADWLERQGLVGSAIEHYLACKNYDQMARLLEKEGRAVWMRGESHTLLKWLNLLPPALVETRPALGLLYAWALIATRQSGQAQVYLKRVEATLSQREALKNSPTLPDKKALKAELLTLQTILARMGGNMPLSLSLAEKALQELAPDNLILRSTLFLNQGHAYRLEGQVVEASQAFAQAVESARQVQNSYVMLLALNLQTLMELMAGQLYSAFKLTQQVLGRVEQAHLPALPLLANTHNYLGEIYYQWNQLEQATEEFNQSLKLAQSNQSLWQQLRAYQNLMKVALAQGQLELAEQIVVQATKLAETEEKALPTQLENALLGLWLRQNKVEQLTQWLAQNKLDLKLKAQPNYWQEFEYLSLLRVLIYCGRADQTLALLERLRQSAQAGGRQLIVLEVLVLQALANRSLGRRTAALAALEKALRLAWPQAYRRLFLDDGPGLLELLDEINKTSNLTNPEADPLKNFVQKLGETIRLELSSSKPEIAPARTESAPGLIIEPLSEREIEVLGYLAAGLSNQAIARELTVADSTIKTHLKNIYRKLEVNNRTSAIDRARKLALL
jgi:LuxR family maltose regulon positive regulatory protein